MTDNALKAIEYTVKDVDTTVRTAWAESRGEKLVCQIGVIWAIRNRVEMPGWWGGTPKEVCQKPWQFSCWNNRGTMEQRMQTMRKHPAWDECVVIASKISQPGYKPSSPATHYYNPLLANPTWASKLTQLKKIGNHLFGRIS